MNTSLVYVVKFFWRKTAKPMQNLEAEEDSDFSQWYLYEDLLFLCPGFWQACLLLCQKPSWGYNGHSHHSAFRSLLPWLTATSGAFIMPMWQHRDHKQKIRAFPGRLLKTTPLPQSAPTKCPSYYLTTSEEREGSWQMTAGNLVKPSLQRAEDEVCNLAHSTHASPLNFLPQMGFPANRTGL